MQDAAWAVALAIALCVVLWPAEPLLLAPDPGWRGLRRWRLAHDGLGDHNTDPDGWVNTLRQSRGLVPGSVAATPARGRGAHRRPRDVPAPPRRPPPPDPHFVPAQDEEAQLREVEAWAGQYAPRPAETVWLTYEGVPALPLATESAPPPGFGWETRYEGPVTHGPDHEPEPVPPPDDDPPTVIRGLRAVMARKPPLPGFDEE
jgi:hypothetical protein